MTGEIAAQLGDAREEKYQCSDGRLPFLSYVRAALLWSVVRRLETRRCQRKRTRHRRPRPTSLTKLLAAVAQLDLERSRVVQLKVFVDSAGAADEVLREIKQLFPDQLVPPVVFVEWIASAPIEIEMIVHLPLQGSRPNQPLRFETPGGEKPSPVFSRVAVIEAFHQIYISGLTARAAGNGEAQVRDVFAHLQQILTETGSDMRHLAKATYYVSDEDASNMLNKLRPEFYDPKRPPAASKAMVHGVAKPDRTLAMDLIAVHRGL